MTTLLCNECGKSFTDEPLLYIHQIRQHDKTSYSCGECGTEVIAKIALYNHKRRHKVWAGCVWREPAKKKTKDFREQ